MPESDSSANQSANEALSSLRLMEQDTNPTSSRENDNDVSTADTSTTSSSTKSSASGRSTKKPRKCRFFMSKTGCRRGAACPFRHDFRPKPEAGIFENSSEAQSQNFHGQHHLTEDRAQHEAHRGRSPNSETTVSELAPKTADNTQPEARIIQKPTPKSQREDPREFELNQLRRRFTPGERTDKHGELLTFSLVPTDPDFPSSICSSLACVMRVPITYRSGGDTEGQKKPTFMVTNSDLDFTLRGKIRARFDDIYAQNPPVSLLRAINLLDRSLTRIFLPDYPPYPETKPSEKPAPPQRFSTSERQDASQRRTREITQLKARLASNSLFAAFNNDNSFVVPVTTANRNSLPPALQKLEKANLIVPHLYPLESCRIEVPGVQDEAVRNLERGFSRHAKESPTMSLIAHVNFISVKLASLAQPPAKSGLVRTQETTSNLSSLSLKEKPRDSYESANLDDSRLPASNPSADSEVTAKPHLHIVPRPPEWDTPNEPEADQEESVLRDGQETSSSDDQEDYEDEEDERNGVHIPEPSAPPPGRGISLSFPSLELEGVELLLLKNVSLVVRCDRCKDHLDIRGLNVGDKPDSKPPRHSATCGKCGNFISVEYRHQLMHANSNRAGFFDLEGCLIFDLLPSTFTPTCAECSVPYNSPGVIGLRGDEITNFCRKCHHKMRLKFPQVKFLTVTSGAGITAKPQGRPLKKPKESLGIHAGQELPRRGKCSHYSKSFRWFRFSCCSKVFPCDKCHDRESDHLNEHANRMICGFCSREQNYRPDNCGTCHATLTGKAGSSFWEGGKGTRDKVRMSRKDPRKYKRRPGAHVQNKK